MNPIHRLAPKAWALCSLMLLAPVPVRANPGHAQGPVAGTLEVAVAGGEIKVTLTFVNHSPKAVWLEKHEEGQAPRRSEFEIRTSDGRLVPSLLPMAKRPAYTKEDFFPLEPGRTYQREIRIDDRYDFPKGELAYRLNCSYLFWNERTREAVFRSLKTAKFSYSR